MTVTLHTILKVLVGSHAHGLATPASDHDYRSVFVIPTEDMFRLGFKQPGTQWTKGQTDETVWEVGAFLTLATQGHPLVLETFLAPVEQSHKWGQRLRSLFPDVWSSEKAFDAFVNYAHNQRQKFLEKKMGAQKNTLRRMCGSYKICVNSWKRAPFRFTSLRQSWERKFFPSNKENITRGK